jgi:putative membrane-bound dehydrogenase-like protein
MKSLLALVLFAAAPQDVGPLSPKDAQDRFRLPKGFRIDLLASEPDLLDPVAMAFDEDGRIYVAEMADYPLGPPSGRIKRLEDLDGDGKFDRCTLFADRVPYPTGVLPWRGGVLVTAAPDILYFKDADGDGKAELREVVFTGFVEGNQQHRVNGLQFGLDNWIHGSNGDSGGNIRRPDAADGKRISIRGTDYRFRADYTGFEPSSGHAQFANTFDDWGNRFINDNSNHIRHPVLPLRYLGRNPQLSVPTVEEMISDHGGSSPVYPISKLQERPNDLFAAGRFTSACSVTVYRADAFGEAYRGSAFVCEPVHNLVHCDLLVPKGASFTAKRAIEDAEFLASVDNWFRPVNLCVGPDGALYVVDMYRGIIEHPQWIPLEMQRRVDLRAGQDRGRIWRVAPEEGLPPARPSLGKASAAELAGQLENPNAWWRTTAQRLLIERQDRSAIPPLRTMLGSPSSRARVHALWTLEGLGGLEDIHVEAALRDPEPWVRVHALRLSEPRLGDAAVRRQAVALADDASPRVRFQAAFSLGGLKDDALDALAGIVVRDAEDRWVRFAVLSSIPGRPTEFLSRVRSRAPEFLDGPRPGALELVRQLADLAGASRDPALVGAWLKALADGAGESPARWRLVALSALGPSIRRWGMPMDRLLEGSGVSATVAAWRRRLADAACDGAREVAERVNALDLLGLLPDPALQERLEGLLRPQEPQEVQAAVIRALAAWPGNPVATRLLDGWARYTGTVRREVLAAVFARPDQVPRVLERLEKGEIRAVELEAHHRDALLKHSNAGVRERAKKALEAKNAGEIDALIDAVFAKMEKLTPDAVAGEKVYQTSCAVCHRLHGQGVDVGPNLGSVAGRDRKALLTDLLNPNRAVAPQYQVYLVKTPTQELISGIIVAETPQSVTLRRAQGEQTTVLRRDILEIKAWPASLMPEGLDAALSAQNFADLIEYLRKGGTSVRPAGASKVFEGNRPETVRPGSAGVLELTAAKAEVYGPTLVFEKQHGNLGYWSSEGDSAAWNVEVPGTGRYAVELDWACDAGSAGNTWTLQAGEAALEGKVEATGNWDTYRSAKAGTLALKAGAQTLRLRSKGRIQGALMDLRALRLVPVKE